MTEPTVVDLAILQAREQRLTMQTVLWTFAASTVYVPSGGDPGKDFRGFQPVYYPGASERVLAVFTDPDLASELDALAPWMVTFTGADLIRRMPAGEGLVVNAGSSVGFELPAAGLAAFRQELDAARGLAQS